ncbi:hypothetical protein [Psychrobacter sp. I-STPA6b]|uniref:hypothetical protein n=1 Tax=Psychrobacter sp. I-STPA6b TaxID=2585718 RepID=UPI001D0C2986|nr:hypothetical protein [Psychrobacter sp. I-STPA6b]
MNHNSTSKITSIASIATALCITLALSGCASTGNQNAGDAMNTASNIGMNVLKVAVDNKCRSEMNQQQVWQIAKVAMTTEQAENIQSRVCGCVSEQAPQHISFADMTNATIDSQYRTQLVARVVAKSLQSCYGSIMSK